MRDYKPAWLQRMENGSIGESRTAAILLDRFWLLDRSVDIEGADWIIQRRLTGRNLLDTHPPRFGVVQAKFYQDSKTTQYVHRDYVLDAEGTPRTEFFLICHTGYEDSSRSYFCPASVIASDFQVVEMGKQEAGKYRIPGHQILAPRYQIVSPSLVLDRIERALEKADFVSNRRFLSWNLPRSNRSQLSIDPKFEEPIDNPHGNIAEEFSKLKEKIESGMYEVEEFYKELAKVVESTDPEQALQTMNHIRYYYGFRISLRDEFHDDYLQDAVDYYKSRVNQLREKGLLDPFIKLEKAVRSHFVELFSSEMVSPVDMDVELSVEYDQKSLQLLKIGVKIQERNCAKEPSQHERYKEVDKSSPGGVVVSLPALWFRMHDYLKGKIIYRDDIPWREQIAENSWKLLRPVMEEVFYHITGKRDWE